MCSHATGSQPWTACTRACSFAPLPGRLLASGRTGYTWTLPPACRVTSRRTYATTRSASQGGAFRRHYKERCASSTHATPCVTVLLRSIARAVRIIGAIGQSAHTLVSTLRARAPRLSGSRIVPQSDIRRHTRRDRAHSSMMKDPSLVPSGKQTSRATRDARREHETPWRLRLPNLGSFIQGS